MQKTTLQFFWKRPAVEPHFQSGVSLHSHTMYSEESFDSLPRHLSRVPFFGPRILSRNGLDPLRSYWTPPLSPRQACRLEEKQIHARFQLPALVSLTDHDDVRAGSLLRILDRFKHAPVSTEWSIPFGPSFFHLGVHNLPPSRANAIMSELASFTADLQETKLAGILAALHALPEVLLVLNHPLWDEKGLGAAPHAGLLSRFLTAHAAFIHALELNGLRPWSENQRVLRLARDMSLPAVSGGDRHALEPNSILNLSRERTFVEFIHEVRYRKVSHIVLMPQYREPQKLRMLRMLAEILADYPESPGRRTWADRIFLRESPAARALPFSVLWNRTQHTPRLLQKVIRAMQLTQCGGMQWPLRLVFGGRECVWPEQESAV